MPDDRFYPPKYSRISMRIPDDALDQLRAYCKSREWDDGAMVSYGRAVTEMIRKYLPKVRDVEPIQPAQPGDNVERLHPRSVESRQPRRKSG